MRKKLFGMCGIPELPLSRMQAGAPGSWLGNDCDIAQCARDKGCATCLGCDSEKTCILFAGASVMPERRKQRAAAREAGQALRRQHKNVGKWLWIYFWMLIPTFIAAFLTNNSVVQVLPGLKFPGEILSILVSVAQCVLLFLLAKEEKNYGYAAWAVVGLVVIDAVTLPLSEEALRDLPVLSALLLMGAAVLEAAVVFYECKGSMTVLIGVDDSLAEKWQKLWKRYWIVAGRDACWDSGGMDAERVHGSHRITGGAGGLDRYDRRGHPAAHLSVQNGRTFPGAVNICRSRSLAAAFSVSYRCTFGPHMV